MKIGCDWLLALPIEAADSDDDELVGRIEMNAKIYEDDPSDFLECLSP